MLKIGSAVHTAHGPGTITDADTVRGRTQFKVSGVGFDVWMDETKVAASEEPSQASEMTEEAGHRYLDWESQWPKGDDDDEGERKEAAYRTQFKVSAAKIAAGGDDECPHCNGEIEHQPNLCPEYKPSYRNHGELPEGAEFEEGTYSKEAPHLDSARRSRGEHWPGHTAALGDVDESNSTTLPYDYTPQNPTEMFTQEQTMSPDHEVDHDERMTPTNSVTGESEEGMATPGPSRELFADVRTAAPGSFRHYMQWAQQAGMQPGQVEAADLYGSTHGLDEDNVSKLMEHFNNQSQRTSSRITAGGWGDVDVAGGEGGGGYSTPGSFDHYMEYSQRNGMHPGDSMTANRYSREHGVSLERSGDYARQSGNGRERGEGLRPEPTGYQTHPSGHSFSASYRPAGLSDKYIDIQAAVDPTDPVTQFRNDPVTFIERTAYLHESSTGLDPRVGQYMDLVEADPMIREAAWRDVRAKAMRLRREGKVAVKDIAPDRIYATVEGDNGVYDVMIAKGASMGPYGGGHDIANWRCGCEWGKWAFKRTRTFIGRLCSHGYASYMELNSQNFKGQPRQQRLPRPPKRRRTSGALEDFKTWAKNENGDTVDIPSADAYISELDQPLSPEEARSIYDYAHENMTERPERVYDVDGYTLDPDEVYDGGNGADNSVLRSQAKPERLSPDLYAVPEGEGQHFTDLDDERKTTGPDQITAKVEKNWAKKQSELDDDHDPIVRFSMRKEALTYTADENLLERLRELSAESPSDSYGSMAERNSEVAEVVSELRDRGYDASLFVAMRKEADSDDDDDNSFLTTPERKETTGADGRTEFYTNNRYDPVGAEQLGDILNNSMIQTQTGDPEAQTVKNTQPAPAAPSNSGEGGGVGGGGSNWSENTNTDPIGPGEYTIQSGDTYSNLAERAGWGDDYQGFANATGYNADNPDLIFAGDTMDVKAPPGASDQPAAEPAAPAPMPGAAAPMSGVPSADPAADSTSGAAAPDPGVGGGLGMLAPPPANPAAPDGQIVSRRFYADEDENLGEQLEPFYDFTDASTAGATLGVGYTPEGETIDSDTTPQSAPQTPAATPAASPSNGTTPAPAASPATPQEPVQEPSDGSKKVLEDQQPQGVNTADPMAGFNSVMPILEGVGGAVMPLVTNTLGPIATGIGNAIGNGLSGLFTAGVVQDGDDIALGDDDYDDSTVVDPAFAGSGPSPKHWYGTSEDYLADHEYLDLNDEPEGDLISYRKQQPKQASYDEESDIVRQFQANIGNTALAGGAGGGGYSDDAIAQAAQGFLRTAGRVYSLAEQQELMDEEHHLGARNLPGLDLRGTHYLEG